MTVAVYRDRFPNPPARLQGRSESELQGGVEKESHHQAHVPNALDGKNNEWWKIQQMSYGRQSVICAKMQGSNTQLHCSRKKLHQDAKGPGNISNRLPPPPNNPITIACVIACDCQPQAAPPYHPPSTQPHKLSQMKFIV